MNAVEMMPPHLVGERLRQAREGANVTQAVAADAIGIARTTIVAIEQGERKIRLGEIQKLAQLYQTTVNALLRQESSCALGFSWTLDCERVLAGGVSR